MSTSVPSMPSVPPEPSEREISYADALAEDGQQMNAGEAAAVPRPRPGQPAQAVQQPPEQNPTPPPAPEDDADALAAEQAREEIEILAPKIQAHAWTFGRGDDVTRTYVQRELSVIAKTQWFSLVGEMLDKALGGQNSMSLNSLLTPPDSVRPGTNFSVQDFRDADTFVQAIGKLLMFAPEFLEKSICIWLSVPDYEWELVRELMKQSPELGGLSDDDAEEIIAIFIDQNYKSLSTFFRDRYGHLRDRWMARAKDHQSRSPRR